MTDRPDPARVVVDADVLAADLLVGGDAREAVDVVRSHSWIDLVASDPLLSETEAVIRDLAGEELAAAWRARIDDERVRVEHPEGDHPALASAYHGGAAHVISFDEELSSAKTGISLQPRVNVSIRPPDAFVAVFDPARLYPDVEDGEYPGPDRDPRA